jgi:hypothetical protein
MKKNATLSFSCTILFLIGIIAAFFGLLNPETSFLTYILLFVSIIYLLSGWYIFKGYYSEGHSLLLFLFGYLYAGVFMSFAFISANWPLANTFVAISVAWAVIQIVMTTVIRKKLTRERFTQFLIEGILMLVMTVIIMIYRH